MSTNKYETPTGPPPTYPSHPQQVHTDAGSAPAGGEASGYYNNTDPSRGVPQQQQYQQGPPQGYYQQQGNYPQQGNYQQAPPPQQGYYQQGAPPQQGYYPQQQQQPMYAQQQPQKTGPSTEEGCMAALCACTAALCCIDFCIF